MRFVLPVVLYCLISVAGCLAPNTMAIDQASAGESQNEVKDKHTSTSTIKKLPDAYFEDKISYINQSLKDNQQKFTDSPKALAKFVDESVLPLWNSSKTIRGLVGKKHWLSMHEQEKLALIKAFNDTIQRYVQEGFALYDGQQISFVKTKLNQKRDRGLVTMLVKPNLLPEFEVDFKFSRHQSQWLLYDILVQGVSYIRLKRDSIRTQLSEQGVSQVLSALNAKNQGFIQSELTVKIDGSSIKGATSITGE